MWDDLDLLTSGGQDQCSTARSPTRSKVTPEPVFYVLIFSLLAVVLVVAFVSTVTRRRHELAREEAEMGDDADWPEQP